MLSITVSYCNVLEIKGATYLSFLLVLIAFLYSLVTNQCQ